MIIIIHRPDCEISVGFVSVLRPGPFWNEITWHNKPLVVSKPSDSKTTIENNHLSVKQPLLVHNRCWSRKKKTLTSTVFQPTGFINRTSSAGTYPIGRELNLLQNQARRKAKDLLCRGAITSVTFPQVVKGKLIPNQIDNTWNMWETIEKLNILHTYYHIIYLYSKAIIIIWVITSSKPW